MGWSLRCCDSSLRALTLRLYSSNLPNKAALRAISTKSQQNRPINTRIDYPTVPAGEEDARTRINVMIRIFNEGSKSTGKADRGLFHEIMTAIHLVENHRFLHGKHISRPLTATERQSHNCNGTSQMVLVRMGEKTYRELDIAYEADGTTCIVEAKNTKHVDASQMPKNVQLAKNVGGRVVYAITGGSSQEKALRAAYEKLAEAQDLPELEIIRISERVAGVHSSIGSLRPLSAIPTSTQIMDADFNCDDGGYHST